MTSEEHVDRLIEEIDHALEALQSVEDTVASYDAVIKARGGDKRPWC